MEDGSFYSDLIVVTPKGIQCEIFLPKEIAKNNKESLIGSKITPPHDDLLIV